MRHFSDRMCFAGYVQVYIPRSASISLGTNKAWRHILPESSTHRQVVITQLAYERDDPPFTIGIIPFLFLFISPRLLPAFQVLFLPIALPSSSASTVTHFCQLLVIPLQRHGTYTSAASQTRVVSYTSSTGLSYHLLTPA